MKRVLLTLLIISLLCTSLVLPGTAWENATAQNLLNGASLSPLATGFTALDRVVSNIFASKIPANASTYEKVKICYDYVNTGASYQGVEPSSSIYSAIRSECNYYKDQDMYYAARAYQFLTNKKGSCIDFADAFMVLARAIGLECYVMHGTYDSGPHYWNLIRLNGNYYIFDTEADWAASGRNGTSTVHSSFCLLESNDRHRSCNRTACINEFGNFQCRNKVNNPGTVIPGQTVSFESTYTTGKYILNEIMNFRSGHSTSDGIYCEIPLGTTVFVMEISENWGKITYNGKTGWISLDYSTKLNETVTTPPATTAPATTVPATSAPVTTTAPASTAPAAEATKIYTAGSYVTTDALNLRANHSLTAGIYSIIPKGTQLTVTEISGEWGKTSYQGVTGWISLKYASFKGESSGVVKTVGRMVTGDADGNGKLTAEDARLILRHFVQIEPIQNAFLSRADINGDGRIDPEDARLVLRKSVHLS